MSSAERPSVETVTKLVASVMDGRKFEALRIDKAEFVFFPSAYNLTLSWDKKTAVVKLPLELIEDVISGNDMFKRRKIKKMIKVALGQPDED